MFTDFDAQERRRLWLNDEIGETVSVAHVADSTQWCLERLVPDHYAAIVLLDDPLYHPGTLWRQMEAEVTQRVCEWRYDGYGERPVLLLADVVRDPHSGQVEEEVTNFTIQQAIAKHMRRTGDRRYKAKAMTTRRRRRRQQKAS